MAMEMDHRKFDDLAIQNASFSVRKLFVYQRVTIQWLRGSCGAIYRVSINKVSPK